MTAMAIEIAATQTKSACADWVITGVANPDLGSSTIGIIGNLMLCLGNLMLYHKAGDHLH